MIKRCKSIISQILILACVFTTCIVPSYATNSEEAIEPCALIYTYYYSRSECKEIYTEMTSYSSWDDILIENLADFVGVGYFYRLNYNLALSAFYKGGYVSGYSGCKVLVYDNASPTVLAY